jgi:predicted nucleotidyltransferase
MTERDALIARDLKRRLRGAVPLVELRVYGSRARGDGDEWSDLDVFVEVENTSPEIRERIADAAWELSLEYLVHVSPLVFTRHELEETPQRSSPVVRNIMREGVTV